MMVQLLRCAGGYDGSCTRGPQINPAALHQSLPRSRSLLTVRLTPVPGDLMRLIAVVNMFMRPCAVPHEGQVSSHKANSKRWGLQWALLAPFKFQQTCFEHVSMHA